MTDERFQEIRNLWLSFYADKFGVDMLNDSVRQSLTQKQVLEFSFALTVPWMNNPYRYIEFLQFLREQGVSREEWVEFGKKHC